ETLLRKASETDAHVVSFGTRVGGLRPSKPPIGLSTGPATEARFRLRGALLLHTLLKRFRPGTECTIRTNLEEKIHHFA
ncbi:MAG: hypothetical protein Q4C35_10365, partial [Eubacteriales bacterium]|nr:hypothetical protein [Eubacteriales bacterium]